MASGFFCAVPGGGGGTVERSGAVEGSGVVSNNLKREGVDRA
jgi:hypothetical protein